jgi:hypothetical protein
MLPFRVRHGPWPGTVDDFGLVQLGQGVVIALTGESRLMLSRRPEDGRSRPGLRRGCGGRDRGAGASITARRVGSR